MAEDNLKNPKYYINREISWLEFNRRCLMEAEDKQNPLLERVKFLAICSNNLEEFFMIRIPGLINNALEPSAPDYIKNDVLFDILYSTIRELIKGYDSCWKKLKKQLAEKDIKIKSIDELNQEQKEWVNKFYKTRVHAMLTPLALDISHPFPFISNNSLNLAFKLEGPNGIVYARLKLPIQNVERFVKIPSKTGDEFVTLDDIVKTNAELLFPGMKILGAYCFSVTRNADVKVTIDEACDLMSAVEESLEGRDTGFPVAFSVESTIPKETLKTFIKNFNLSDKQVFKFKDTVSLTSLWQLTELNRPDLKEKVLNPYTPPEFSEDADIFATIKKKDWILYHPYESFNSVVKFINDSAKDKKVKSIKICLYRIGKEPSIYKALKLARENGKDVSVLMELRAKFDENRNIRWAKELEQIGVHVVYGPVNLKVHSKLLQVVRLEGDKLVRYTHLSSGNYNVSTAKQYGDISFFTSNQEIGEDVGELFNLLTGYFTSREYHHLLVAPTTLKKSIIDKIHREIECQKRHKNGLILMKANGLVDPDIISSLYEASIAGVKIELNIRGLCCLRPGLKNISENIKVTSIVDRFLEHARIYYFHNNGASEMYMGSSDLMPRNLINRVEVLYPVLDSEMRNNILNNILKIHLADNVKARVLKSDGSYVTPKSKGKKIRSQQWMMENRGIWHGSEQ